MKFLLELTDQYAKCEIQGETRHIMFLLTKFLVENDSVKKILLEAMRVEQEYESTDIGKEHVEYMKHNGHDTRGEFSNEQEEP